MWGEARLALGKRIREGPKDPWREIVGVAGDVYDDGVQQKAPAFVYWPAMMDNFWGDSVRVNRGVVLIIRTKRAATESFLAEARQAIWSVNANLPVFQVRTLKDVYDRSMARTSFTLVMLAIAGGMALVLGVVGIYGVIAYAVSQRTREIGIRIALGAPPAGLQRMFVRHGLLLAGIGAVLGVAGACGVDAPDVVAAVWDHRARSGDLRRGLRAPACGRCAGQLPAGAAGHGGGSGAGAAIRVTRPQSR